MSETTATGPATKRFKSKQDLETPWEFIRAVEKRYGPLTIDLAGSEKNKKAPVVITPEEDSLKQDWRQRIAGGLGWLNPEYDPVTPWMKKCALTVAPPKTIEDIRVKSPFLTLTRGSVDANWFWNYMWPNAAVYALSPRITFDNQLDKHGNPIAREDADVYPSPLILSVWDIETPRRLYRWNWKDNVIE